MAALIPLGLTALSAIPGFISGILGAVNEGKKLHGGRIRRRRVHKRKVHRKRKGKGVAADIIGSIPLLGSIVGPIVRALGGKLRKRKYKHRKHKRHMLGHGLAPMYYTRKYVGKGIRKRKHRKMRHRKHRRGYGLAPMYYRRPYVGKGLLGPVGSRMLIKHGYGLLAPAGGYIPWHGKLGGMVRKGHLRKIPGRAARVRVRPTLLIGYSQKKS